MFSGDNRRMVDFIILGAQKAATSALQASLRKHPSVYMPVGESPFFEEPEYKQSLWINFADKEGYSKIKGIKRPDYLCSATARVRIKQALPNCKFLVVLREPVSRAISSYCYMVRHAHLPAKPLNEGLRDCLAAFEQGLNNRAASVISYGLYGSHLTEWFQIYDKERFLIISQDEVGQELDSVLSRSLKHLGLAEDLKDCVNAEGIESNVGLYDPELLRFARVASMIKTRPIIGTERREPRILPFRVIGVVLSRFIEYIAKNKRQSKEQLSEELTRKLNKLYVDDSKLLKDLVPVADKFKWINK